MSQGNTLHLEKSCTAPTSLHLPFSHQIQDNGVEAEKATEGIDCGVNENMDGTTGLVLTMHKIREGGEVAGGQTAETSLDAAVTAGRSRPVTALTSCAGPTERAQRRHPQGTLGHEQFLFAALRSSSRGRLQALLWTPQGQGSSRRLLPGTGSLKRRRGGRC